MNEVVTALETDALIQSAVVLADTAVNGENRLAAYLVKVEGTKTSDEAIECIKSALSIKVPAYMVPSNFYWVNAIPLLPNGKLDRSQLPTTPALEDLVDTTEDATEDVESYLIKEWKYILGASHINPQRSFVDMGGDSLSFIQASMVVEKAIGWLPEDWEKLSISHLAMLPKQSGSKTSEVGMPIVFRALSIVLVVLGHLYYVGGNALNIEGSTKVLFIISGLSLELYQIPEILKKGTVNPLLTLALKIMIPTAVVTFFYQIATNSFHAANYLFILNFTDPGYNWKIEFWYVMVLLQIILLFAVPFHLEKLDA